MKNNERYLVFSAALLAIGITASLLFMREKEKRNQSQIVADEGYELASDVLFADDAIKTRQLKYGPVYPA